MITRNIIILPLRGGNKPTYLQLRMNIYLQNKYLPAPVFLLLEQVWAYDTPWTYDAGTTLNTHVCVWIEDAHQHKDWYCIAAILRSDPHIRGRQIERQSTSDCGSGSRHRTWRYTDPSRSRCRTLHRLQRKQSLWASRANAVCSKIHVQYIKRNFCDIRLPSIQPHPLTIRPVFELWVKHNQWLVIWAGVALRWLVILVIHSYAYLLTNATEVLRRRSASCVASKRRYWT